MEGNRDRPAAALSQLEGPDPARQHRDHVIGIGLVDAGFSLDFASKRVCRTAQERGAASGIENKN